MNSTARFKVLFLNILVLAVLGSIWVPPIRQNWHSVPTVTTEQVREATRRPEPAALKAILAASPALLYQISSADKLREQAANVAKGMAQDPVLGLRKIDLPFSEANAMQGSGLWQLFYSGLSLPEILLKDYELTGNRQDLILARDMIYQFLLWEKNVHWSVGYIWCDHSLAGRVLVLSRFWSDYRADPEYDEKIGTEVLAGVARAGTLLASPNSFTYNTNHGVMQNLALLEASLAFPTLPQAEMWRKIARERLLAQLDFFISQEGVVLEHSPHYHEFGAALLDSAMSLSRLAGADLPADVGSLVEKAKAIGAWMRRPDGSNPVFGDTIVGPSDAVSDSAASPEGNTQVSVGGNQDAHLSLFPISGLGGWVGLSPDGRTVSHSTQSWAYFQRNGHAHADELSISLWFVGGPDIVNAGYWSYDLPGRQEAVGWTGSNAPHFIGEPAIASRPQPQLVGYSDAPALRGFVISRDALKGSVQRQFYQLGEDYWLVLDLFRGQDRRHRGETIWRVSGRLEARANDKPTAIWVGAGGKQIRGAFLADSVSPCEERVARAVFSSGIQPVDCLVLRTTAVPSFIFSIWSNVSSETRGAHESLQFVAEDDWEISGLADRQWQKLVRRGNRLSLIDGDAKSLDVFLKPAPDVRAERSRIAEANLQLGKQYPKYMNIDTYRWRITYGLLALAAIQAFLLWLTNRRFPSHLNIFVALSALSWIGLGGFLNMVYFVTG